MSEPFDRASLLDRVDHDTEFLAETVALLVGDAPPLLEEIRRAAAAGDAKRLAKAAHAFKGMASNFCAEPVESAAQRLEAMGRGGELNGLEEAVTALVAEADRLKQALHELVESM